MLAIGIRYLCGWAMATDTTDRSRAEWPPHPDRVFMALAAAHFETEGEAIERDALRWLEQQGAPSITAGDATTRVPVTTYVPANDTSLPKSRQGKEPSPEGLQLLPERRLRNARQFPVAIPRDADPTVFLTWPDDPPEASRRALEGLCAKVVCIGHSASLVQAWIEDSPPAPTLTPADGAASHRLRVTGPGRLEHLEARHAEGLRPERSLWRGYHPPEAVGRPLPPSSVFDHRLLVLRRVEGSPLGLESTLRLTQTLRRALIKASPQPVPEWLSGHTPDGRPSERPHLAFLPLPHVAAEHADGHLLGAALAVPRDVPAEDVGRCLDSVLGWDADGAPRRLHLFDGPLLDWRVELERGEAAQRALQALSWTAPARRWATVTPVVFDRHPKGVEQDRDLQEMVAEACRRIGLPTPTEVVLTPVSLHAGVPHRRAFPLLRRKSDNGARNHAHVVLIFEQPVRGPVLLGAGRYAGYGFFRPIQDTEGGGRWTR